MPWVQLKAIKYLRSAGKTITYYPGDSLEVSRRQALDWTLDGTAADLFGEVLAESLEPGRFGILILDSESSKYDTVLPGFPKKFGGFTLPYEYTFILDPSRLVREQLVSFGFLRLRDAGWEAAATLRSLDFTLALYGTSADQEATKELVGDLRVIPYDPRALWIKQSDAGRALVKNYSEYLNEGVEKHHAFIRSLYLNKVMLFTLPSDRYGA